MTKKILRIPAIKKGICILIILFFIINLLIFPTESIDAAKSALLLCANVLIPSLFPFFVFSYLLISLGFASLIARPMSKIMRPLFGVSGAGALCLVLGVISGYPLGASCVCDMYRDGALTKNEAEKLLAFCNNSGPLFIIGSVGAAMYGSREIGVMLYSVHILSALSVGVIIGCFNRGKANHIDNVPIHCAKPFGQIIKEAVVGSVNNILLVCGFTVLFAVIISTVSHLLSDGALKLITGGILEISTGTYAVSTSQLPLGTRLIAASAVIGFAGLSVHFQVIGIVSKTNLSTKLYFIGKTLQAFIAVAYTAVALHNMSIGAYADYCYPIRPYELLDFAAAMKLSLLYMISAVFVMLLFWLFEKICAWQEKVKHKR